MLLCFLPSLLIVDTKCEEKKKGNRRAQGALPLPVEKEQEGTKEQ
jgi:hypothetical protein